MKHPCEVHDGKTLQLIKGGCMTCVLKGNACYKTQPEQRACIDAIGMRGYGYAPDLTPAPTPIFGVGNVNYCGTTYEVRQ
jgi:hypothetical protein